MLIIYRLVLRLFNLYELAILIRVLLSWLNIRNSNVFTDFIYGITEPFLGFVRDLLYNRLNLNTGMLDISPVVALFILRIALKGLLELVLRI